MTKYNSWWENWNKEIPKEIEPSGFGNFLFMEIARHDTHTGCKPEQEWTLEDYKKRFAFFKRVNASSYFFADEYNEEQLRMIEIVRKGEDFPFEDCLKVFGSDKRFFEL